MSYTRSWWRKYSVVHQIRIGKQCSAVLRNYQDIKDIILYIFTFYEYRKAVALSYIVKRTVFSWKLLATSFYGILKTELMDLLMEKISLQHVDINRSSLVTQV